MNMYKEIPIKEHQITEESIRYLRAQSQSYKIAKQIYMARMFLSIVWPLVAIFMYFFFDNKFATEILIISSIIVISTFIMELYEKKHKVIIQYNNRKLLTGMLQVFETSD
ncbi:S-4TM family putative pore-forming effector [Peribacillus frigoritolerans]|uniref:S-4TM family putative pore-forming effector n=1 Tax=Peribacillus frigoritolerans TaxID=450367 RepID=UPI0034E08664